MAGGSGYSSLRDCSELYIPRAVCNRLTSTPAARASLVHMLRRAAYDGHNVSEWHVVLWTTRMAREDALILEVVPDAAGRVSFRIAEAFRCVVVGSRTRGHALLEFTLLLA